MVLREFRRLVSEISGRYDLINEDYSNNGIDFFIRAGQKYLESVIHWDKARAVKNYVLQNTSSFMLQQVRVVENVAVKSPEDSVFRNLVRVPIHYARQYIKEGIDYSAPLFYVLFRHIGQLQSPLMADFFDKLEETDASIIGQNYADCGVLLVPIWTSPQELRVEVTGLFRSPTLEDDEDSNVWTDTWSNLLLYATLRELEISTRNTQGVKDWEYALNTSLVQLEMDMVQDEAHDVTRMLG